MSDSEHQPKLYTITDQPRLQHRQQWLTMLKLALCTFIIPGWPGTAFLVLALSTCSELYRNSEGVCRPDGSISSILGLTLCCISFLGLIAVVAVLFLRHSTWYRTGAEGYEWIVEDQDGASIEQIVAEIKGGKRYRVVERQDLTSTTEEPNAKVLAESPKEVGSKDIGSK